jgi:hypothetical protein
LDSRRSNSKEVEMPAEEFTHTGTDVASRVRTGFGDSSGAQLADSSILSWINDGQREIVNSNPILRATKITDVVAGQSDYSFPNDKVLSIEALYISGYPLTNLSPQAAREYIQAQDPAKLLNSERPDVWYERAGIITLFPVPNKTISNGLKLEYVSNPANLSVLGSTLAVPDRYFNELVSYVIAQALEMDENYDASNMKLRQFRDGLDRLSTKDTISQDSQYTAVMADPADAWY